MGIHLLHIETKRKESIKTIFRRTVSHKKLIIYGSLLDVPGFTNIDYSGLVAQVDRLGWNMM